MADKQKKRTTRKNTKNIKKIKEQTIQEIEDYIAEKILNGDVVTDNEFKLYFSKFGFKDGKIPEPVELPLGSEDDLLLPPPITNEPPPTIITFDDKSSPVIHRPPTSLTESPAFFPQVTDEKGKQKKQRCPKGTRRNKNGNCEPVDTGTIPKRVISNAPVVAKSTGIGELSDVPATRAQTGVQIENDKTPVIEPESVQQFINNPVLIEDEPETRKKPVKTAINQFLSEKEKLEHAHPLENREYLYPDLNDPNFNIKIALKKEFRDAQYDGKIHDIEKQANLLCKAKFELSPHQVFVKNFLSSDTPYKGLLLYHGLGTGKTCSAIGVAEEMRQYMKRTGLKRQIFVIASPNVQGNFRQQLFDERKLTKVTNAANPNEFTWNIESCVGNSLLNEINPNSIRNLSREKLISNINSLINENYAFIGYIQFANVARAHMLVSSEEVDAAAREEQSIRKFFDERLIIIDEVHNIRLADDSNRKEMQQVAAVLMKVVKHARGLRLLLLSATPMFNSYKEIIWITNLLNANDERSLIQTSNVFQPDGSFQPGDNDTTNESGESILRRKLTGYVSYVRGENPYTFPYRLYPAVFSPENSLQSFVYPTQQMNGHAIDEPIQNINVYVNRAEKTTYQMSVYLSIIDYMRRKSHGFYTNAGIYREMPTFENMESFGYTLLQRPLEALNIVYPDEDVSNMLREDNAKTRANYFTDELFQNAIGGTGLAKTMTFDTLENSDPLKHNYEYLPNTLKTHGRVFSPEELPKYSAKMAEICNCIKASKGIVLIYSQYIDGGVVPMALALEEMGFSRYCHSYAGRHKHLFKRAPTAQIDAITMTSRNQMQNAGDDNVFQPAQYIMITGDKGLSPSNTEDVKYATNSDNMNGSKVKVIIISKAGSEGLDFKAIRQIHILEPWFNMNRIEQIIGRGVRNLSHCALPFKKRNVQIYLHSTVINGVEEEAADLYLYRLAEKKAMQIGRVTRVLKENAADCLLNIGQTNFTAENISSLVANQNIRLELSSKDSFANIREVDFRIGDLDGSEICDYMSCEYQCKPNYRQKEGDENIQSYTQRNLESNIYYIIGRIKELYRERHVYTLTQICAAINVVRVYPIAQIYYVLSRFVDNRNMVLFDKYGRFGYLLNRGKYYEFQPVEITDERSSVRDRSVPVEYKRGNIILELPDRIAVDNTAKTNKKQKPAANAPTEEPTEKPLMGEVEQNSYQSIIKEISRLLNIVKTYNAVKSTETDWYKNASRALEHLHVVYGFDEERIIRYVIFHFLDSANYETKRILFQTVVDIRVYEIDPEIETHIAYYFRNSIMRSKSGDREGIFIANREDAQLIVRSLEKDEEEEEEEETDWKEGDKFDAEEFDEEIKAKYLVDKKRLSDIIGYMIQFKDQDISFYYKDIHLTRNKKGRRCDRSGGKAPIIDMLNRVTKSKIYTEENTASIMYSGSLCVVLEMLLRKFHEDATNTSRKIYYLTPEQAIKSKITDYSAVSV